VKKTKGRVRITKHEAARGSVKIIKNMKLGKCENNPMEYVKESNENVKITRL
jgi:hypothetical protein